MATTRQRLLIEVELKNAKALGTLKGQMAGFKSSTLNAATALKSFAGFLAVRQIIEFGKQIRNAASNLENMRNRLRLITSGQDDLNQTYARLVQLAVENRTSVQETIDLYTKLRVTTKDLGATTEQVELITARLSKALVIAGADGNTANSVIRQFGQAMASGTVRGDEFRSIVEGLGPALSIMADETGVNIGELRKLSQSGKLTAEVFANMLLQANSLDERFKLLNPTIDTLEQKTGDAFDRFLAKIGEATGLTALYKRSLESLSEFFDRQAGLYDPEELLALKKFEQAQAEVEKSIERIRDDLIIAQSMMDEGSESMLMEQLEKELAMLDKIIQAKVDSNRETAKNVPLLKKIDPRIKAISDALDKMAEKYSDVSMISKLVENSFTTFGNVATRELTSVIFEAKRLDVALGNIARETLKAIIQGFIEMAIVAPIVRFLVDQFKELLGITKKDNDEQAKKNKLLEREIKLRAILALFGLGGFANGGEVGYANGGSIGYGGARALGGPVAGANAYLVGERGPELFVPNSAGTIVPNERLGSSMGDTNINFNISATDASSFDSMLVQRRGLITNIINDALSRQGRRFA